MRRAIVLTVAVVTTVLVGAGPAGAKGAESMAARAPVYGVSTLNAVEVGNVRVYQDLMSDPRVSGVRSATVHRYLRSDGSGAFWGTSTITGDLGKWSGPWNGLVGRGGVQRYYSADLEGSGRYEGLVYHVDARFEGPERDPFPGSRFAVFGWIEAADGSPVEVLPPSLPKGMTPVVGDATFVSEDPDWNFTLTMSDDRVDGDLVAAPWPSFPPRPDKSLDFTAPFVLTSPQGTWDCTDGIGTAAKGGSEHFTYCEAPGKGAYAGLVFRSLWHFFEPLNPGEPFTNAGLIVRT